ncbi:hypothetical protein D3C72_2458160 [compost metagenome]
MAFVSRLMVTYTIGGVHNRAFAITKLLQAHPCVAVIAFLGLIIAVIVYNQGW